MGSSLKLRQRFPTDPAFFLSLIGGDSDCGHDSDDAAAAAGEPGCDVKLGAADGGWPDLRDARIRCPQVRRVRSARIRVLLECGYACILARI